MQTDTAARVKILISRLDWSLFKGSAVITAGMILARGVGFVVTLLLARLFDPAGFGVILYAVSIAGILAIGTQPLGQHVLARYVSMQDSKGIHLPEILSNFWLIAAIVFGLSSFVGVLILVETGKCNPGILAIFLGLSLFYFYWGLARGFLASWKMLIADVGNNIVKVILIFWFIQLLGMRSTMLAMLIYGFSCLIPLALLQRFSPLPILFDWKLINKKTAIEIGKFSLPIMISHASYMVYMTIAVIFLEQYTSAAIVGIYSLALTLGVMFSFLPTGLATFLMPKISGAPGLQHGKMLLSALGLAMLINIVLLAAYYFLVPMLIGKLFSPDYLVIPEVFVTTGMVMTLMGIHTIVSAVFVGSGRAQDETKSRLVTVMLTALSCWWLIPRFGIMGAVSANLIGIIGGLGIYALIFLLDRFKINREIN